jgi:hypothetical protein
MGASNLIHMWNSAVRGEAMGASNLIHMWNSAVRGEAMGASNLIHMWNSAVRGEAMDSRVPHKKICEARLRAEDSKAQACRNSNART